MKLKIISFILKQIQPNIIFYNQTSIAMNNRPTLLKIQPAKDNSIPSYHYGNENHWLTEMNNRKRSIELSGDQINERLFASTPLDFIKLLLEVDPEAKIPVTVVRESNGQKVKQYFDSLSKANEKNNLRLTDTKEFAILYVNGGLTFEQWPVNQEIIN